MSSPATMSAPAAMGFMPTATRPGAGGVEEGAGDEGLADLGVGAGDEEGGHGRFSAISQKVS
jgi:hypothetical protein